MESTNPTAGTTADTTIHPLCVDTRGLAVLIATPYNTVTKLCAAKAWQADELPAPVFIGNGSRRRDGSGNRRWIISDVHTWLQSRREVAA